MVTQLPLLIPVIATVLQLKPGHILAILSVKRIFKSSLDVST